MNTLVFANGTAILEDRLLPDAMVVCRNGKIESVGPRRKSLPKGADLIDARGGYISPGFVDVHVHGGGGADFMDGTEEAVRTACQVHARHGTTTIFPTTTTGAPSQIEAMLDACRSVQKAGAAANGARIEGVHLYGPFFAEDKVGAHNPAGRRSPTAAEYNRYFDTGIVRIATCAAELPGAEAFYREAKKRRCFITCGHSNASWSEMAAAFRRGMRHVDHFWCAMSSVPSVRARLDVPMQGSMAEFVIATPDMSTEVIADGRHLAPELLEFAWRMKSAQRLFLVTDSCRAVDMPPGVYRIGPREDGTEFVSDGITARMRQGGGLASTVVGMDHMVRHFKKNTTAPLHEVVRMASLTPAERTGISRRAGSLHKGKRADVIVLGKDLQTRRVFIGGQEFARGSP